MQVTVELGYNFEVEDAAEAFVRALQLAYSGF